MNACGERDLSLLAANTHMEAVELRLLVACKHFLLDTPAEEIVPLYSNYIIEEGLWRLKIVETTSRFHRSTTPLLLHLQIAPSSIRRTHTLIFSTAQLRIIRRLVGEYASLDSVPVTRSRAGSTAESMVTSG